MATPTKLTKKNIEELEKRFRDGATTLEAIDGIMAESSYYKYLLADEDFAERMSLARDYVTEIARGNVARKIKRGDTALSTWWLERKKSDEFSTKSKVENSGEQKIIVETRKYGSKPD